MKEYHKIQTVFKRDTANKNKIIVGDFTIPEFEYLANNEWIFTEKVNGTNIRVMYDVNQITFGGKTDTAMLPATLVKILQDKYLPQLSKFQEIFGEAPVCLYGEGYGARIQKGGGNYRQDQSLVLFDVDVNSWILHRHNVEDVASKLQSEVVPVIGRGTLHDMVLMCKEGFKSQWGDFEAEGIVARPAVEMKTRKGERIITKLKCKDFK